jgi:hypothetical protein
METETCSSWQTTARPYFDDSGGMDQGADTPGWRIGDYGVSWSSDGDSSGEVWN